MDGLADEQIINIKKFVKDYVAKVLRKLEKSKSHLTDEFNRSSSPSSRNKHRDGEQGLHVRTQELSASGSVPSHPPDIRRDAKERDREAALCVEQAVNLTFDNGGKY